MTTDLLVPFQKAVDIIRTETGSRHVEIRVQCDTLGAFESKITPETVEVTLNLLGGSVTFWRDVPAIPRKNDQVRTTLSRL